MIRIITLAAALLAGAGAQAQSQDWSGQATVYGWGAAVSGDFTPFTGAPTLTFDKSLSEVLADLDTAFFATGLARRGDLVILGDLTYSASSRAGVLPGGVPAAGEVTITSLTFAAGKRFDAGAGGSIDMLAGVRGWRLDGQVSVPLAGVSAAPRREITDPIIAIRANGPLSDRWSVIGYGDVGGFGVGSDLTWQIALTANYRVTDSLFASVGWRQLEIDYSNDGTVFKGAMSGPLFGLTYTF